MAKALSSKEAALLDGDDLPEIANWRWGGQDAPSGRVGSTEAGNV